MSQATIQSYFETNFDIHLIYLFGKYTLWLTRRGPGAVGHNKVEQKARGEVIIRKVVIQFEKRWGMMAGGRRGNLKLDPASIYTYCTEYRSS